MADEWFRANGWRPLKPHEQAVVNLSFSAIHGEQKTSQAMDADALAAAHAVTRSGLAPVLVRP